LLACRAFIFAFLFQFSHCCKYLYKKIRETLIARTGFYLKVQNKKGEYMYITGVGLGHYSVVFAQSGNHFCMFGNDFAVESWTGLGESKG
jgi:hypothetical protein